jgi:hypothetical protein
MRCVHCGWQTEAGKELALLSARGNKTRTSGLGESIRLIALAGNISNEMRRKCPKCAGSTLVSLSSFLNRGSESEGCALGAQRDSGVGHRLGSESEASLPHISAVPDSDLRARWAKIRAAKKAAIVEFRIEHPTSRSFATKGMPHESFTRPARGFGLTQHATFASHGGLPHEKVAFTLSPHLYLFDPGFRTSFVEHRPAGLINAKRPTRAANVGHSLGKRI